MQTATALIGTLFETRWLLDSSVLLTTASHSHCLVWVR